MLGHLLAPKTTKTQIGIAENSQYRCLVWLENQEFKVHWQVLPDKLDPLLQGGRLFEKSAKKSYRSPRDLIVIRPLPKEYIWQKKTILPLASESELYKQIIQIFQQEMPLALSEVYFDYHIAPNKEQNIANVILNAVRKSYVHSLNNRYETILDSESHCLTRALYTLRPNLIEQDELDIDTELNNIQLSELPSNTLNKSLYILALGASLWNGRV